MPYMSPTGPKLVARLLRIASSASSIALADTIAHSDNGSAQIESQLQCCGKSGIVPPVNTLGEAV